MMSYQLHDGPGASLGLVVLKDGSYTMPQQ